jgi:hypothetical protein
MLELRVKPLRTPLTTSHTIKQAALNKFDEALNRHKISLKRSRPTTRYWSYCKVRILSYEETRAPRESPEQAVNPIDKSREFLRPHSFTCRIADSTRVPVVISQACYIK